MSEGPDIAPPLMALLLGDEAPVECEANLVSYFDPVVTYVLGNEALGYIGTASLKTSHPRGLPYEEKSTGTEMKSMMLQLL
jgi:hypothetical protein